MRSVAAVVAAVLGGITGGGLAAEVASGNGTADAIVRDYDLGETTIDDGGPLGPLPVKLWGVIAVPASPGPHPLVIVAHGRHGDNCPLDQDLPTWPCFADEQRNDLGMKHVVRALASDGVVAIAPDLNGAHTAGWGEPDDRLRWPRIVNRTVTELVEDATNGGTRFGTELSGTVDPARLGVLGHSLSGLNAARLARKRVGNTAPSKVDAGKGPITSAFLLAPVAGNGRLPDIEATVVLASCDGDTGAEGRRYLQQARNDRRRTRPLFMPTLKRANHNYFNRSLAQLGEDDAQGMRGRCRRSKRLRGSQQQAWLDRAASAFFSRTLLGGPRPRWMRLHGRLASRMHGKRVTMRRFVP